MKARCTYCGPQFGLKGEYLWALVNEPSGSTVVYKPHLHSLSMKDHLQRYKDSKKNMQATDAIYSVLDAYKLLGR